MHKGDRYERGHSNVSKKINREKSTYAGRASNLFLLGFGEMISVSKRRKTKEVAEYALNSKCSWRLTNDYKIKVASQDFYSPNSVWNGDNENFNWDVLGSNRFDERIKSFMDAVKEQLVVEKIDFNEVSGLNVYLSDNYLLEVVPDSPEDDEYSEFWRLFNRRVNSQHFVVTGNGIEKV